MMEEPLHGGPVHIISEYDGQFVCGLPIGEGEPYYEIQWIIELKDDIEEVMFEQGFDRCEECWKDIELLILGAY